MTTINKSKQTNIKSKQKSVQIELRTENKQLTVEEQYDKNVESAGKRQDNIVKMLEKQHIEKVREQLKETKRLIEAQHSKAWNQAAERAKGRFEKIRD